MKSCLFALTVVASFLLAACGGASVTSVTNVPNGTSGYNEWTWVSGSNVANQNGTYGTQGTSAPGNVPGAREWALTWTDAAGNLWLFGGDGYDPAGPVGSHNDLWEYSAGQWTWASGSNLVRQSGTYGTLGTAAAGNVPGARESATSWTDASGNFWLFGGFGGDSTGASGPLNDLWKYDPTLGQWTWMGGSNLVRKGGTYGTQGTAAAGNVPGARDWALTWTDAAGNVWLFGGAGYDSVGGVGDLNDLWKYSPTSGQWTWVDGPNVINGRGTYGTQGTAAPGDLPGARSSSIRWTDAAGDFLLFGGSGFDSTGSGPNFLNDLWKYSPTLGQWTWVGGSNVANQNGTYGMQGMPSPANIPGGRDLAIACTDAAGNFCLFGGQGYDSSGKTNGYLNDLWKYSPTSGQWTWMDGSSIANQLGTYGTQGTPASGNIPGAREGSAGWTDAAGNFWLFGGIGNGSLNDLWEYKP